jgi:hypothetical protein
VQKWSQVRATGGVEMNVYSILADEVPFWFMSENSETARTHSESLRRNLRVHLVGLPSYVCKYSEITATQLGYQEIKKGKTR